MKNRNKVATFVAVSAAAFGLYECASTQHEQTAQFKREIGREVLKDGFTTARGISGGRIGELVLGRCTFHDVTVNVSGDRDKVTDVSEYSFAVGQTGQGKFRSDSLTIEFDNEHEVREALPDLNCGPK